MTKHDLADTAARLMDEISIDPANWRAFEDRLRALFLKFSEHGLKVPAQLRVYETWLSDDDLEDSFENMPV